MNESGKSSRATNQEGELISGYEELAKFLTNNNFPIKKNTLDRWHSRGRGVPIHGRWGGKCLFSPADALAWAKQQMYGAGKTAKAAKKPLPPPSVAPVVEDDAPPF